MTVTVEPLAIGSLDGPRVWIVTRRMRGHLDIQQAPDDIRTEADAVGFAADLWNVPNFMVTLKPVQVVEIEA